MCRRLGHAAALHDGNKHVQVAQLDAAANLTFPIDFSRHERASMRVKGMLKITCTEVHM